MKKNPCGLYVDPDFTDDITVTDLVKGISLYVGEGFLIFAFLHITLSVNGSMTIVLDYWYSLIALAIVCFVLGGIANVCAFLLKKLM